MKKIVLSLCMLAGAVGLVSAQETVTPITDEAVDSIALLKHQLAQANEQLSAEEAANRELRQEIKWQGIWGKGKYTQLSYGVSATARQEGMKFRSAWSFSLSKGTTYLFPKRPIAGMVKLGFDIRWFDYSVTKYKKTVSFSDDDFGGWDFPDYGYDDDHIDVDMPDIGHYDMHVSVFGIGPAVSVAPLSHLDNAARYLRATLYFHYLPTLGLHLVSEDGDMETSTAYCNMWDFGGKIQYRRIAIGIEGRWGTGKYSNLVSSDDFDYDDDDFGFGDEPKGKIKRKFASTRLYISFTF